MVEEHYTSENNAYLFVGSLSMCEKITEILNQMYFISLLLRVDPSTKLWLVSLTPSFAFVESCLKWTAHESDPVCFRFFLARLIILAMPGETLAQLHDYTDDFSSVRSAVPAFRIQILWLRYVEMRTVKGSLLYLEWIIIGNSIYERGYVEMPISRWRGSL